MNKGRQNIMGRIFAVYGFCLMTLLAHAGHGECASVSKPLTGGSLTVGVDREFSGFDPMKASYLALADRSVAVAVEERLFDIDAKGDFVPELALSATSSKDRRTWTVKLRKAVQFHDGAPFNADAVVGHWQRMLDPKNHFSGLSLIEPVLTVEKVDEYAVRFKLKHAWTPFKQLLASPEWISAYIPSPKAVKNDTQNRAPVGTGPYMFKEWISNDRLVLVKNPNYWRKGKAFLDTVTFRPMPDMQARFASLQSGESDVILTDRGASILQAREDRALKIYASDSAGAYNFIFNTSRPPLDDVRVRQALAHAWNQDLLLKADYKGTLPFAKDPFGGQLSCGDVAYREYDPAKARKLIAAYGKPVTLEMIHTNTSRGKEAGEIMQRLFKEIGVTLKLIPVGESQLVKRGMSGDYQISGWRVMDYDEMGPYLFAYLHSTGSRNFGKYKNPKMDDLLMTQQMSTDRKIREKALCGVAKLINEDAVYLYGGGRRFHIIAKAGVKRIDNVRNGVIRVSDAWLEQK